MAGRHVGDGRAPRVEARGAHADRWTRVRFASRVRSLVRRSPVASSTEAGVVTRAEGVPPTRSVLERGGRARSRRRRRAPLPLSVLAKVIAGSAAALVGSVAVDAALDRDGARVAALANDTIPDGIRAYVARPPGSIPRARTRTPP